jgi:hypothetical protein
VGDEWRSRWLLLPTDILFDNFQWGTATRDDAIRIVPEQRLPIKVSDMLREFFSHQTTGSSFERSNELRN